MRRWRSCSPKPRPCASNSQCDLACSLGCPKPCCTPRRRCRSVSPTRQLRPFYMQRQDPLWGVCDEPESCYRVKRPPGCSPQFVRSPPRCDSFDWRVCTGSPNCSCWKCIFPSRRFRVCAAEKCEKLDCRYPPRRCYPCGPKTREPCPPRRHSPCYSRKCDPCDRCHPRRCDPYVSCSPRFCSPCYPRKCSPCESPYEPCCRPCSPPRCRSRRCSPSETFRLRLCDPCRPCYSPNCRICRTPVCQSSSTNCTVEERVLKSGRLIRDKFTKVCYPRAVPCRAFDKSRSNTCSSCKNQPCHCKSTQELNGAGPGITIGSPCPAPDQGPSTNFLEKSRKLGKALERYTPHYCPWEADVSISGTIRGHCNSTAVEVARRMTGRFKASGDRYTMDSCPKQERCGPEPQRMSLGILDDGTALNLSRNNNPGSTMTPYTSHRSPEQRHRYVQESPPPDVQPSHLDRNYTSRKTNVNHSDYISASRDYNISCCTNNRGGDQTLDDREHFVDRSTCANEHNSCKKAQGNNEPRTIRMRAGHADLNDEMSVRRNRLVPRENSGSCRCLGENNAINLAQKNSDNSQNVSCKSYLTRRIALGDNEECSKHEQPVSSRREADQAEVRGTARSTSELKSESRCCPSTPKAKLRNVKENVRYSLDHSENRTQPAVSPHAECIRLSISPETHSLKIRSSVQNRQEITALCTPPSYVSRENKSTCSSRRLRDRAPVAHSSDDKGGVHTEVKCSRHSMQPVSRSERTGPRNSNVKTTTEQLNFTQKRSSAKATNKRIDLQRDSDNDYRKSCLSSKHGGDKKIRSRKKRVTYSGE